MGIADAFSREDRVEVKFTDFYNLMKRAAHTKPAQATDAQEAAARG